MNAPQKAPKAMGEVNQQAVQPLPNSRKIYVPGSRPDIQVPMREISLSDTPTDFGGEKNAPVLAHRRR